MKKIPSNSRKGLSKSTIYASQARKTPSLAADTVLRKFSPDLGGAFEVDNAKKLSVQETVDYFVSTPGFERLISRKNHIIIGSRGSGKTTWVRMLAHDHMVLAAKKITGADYARKALAENLIGIYVPTNVGFVGSLKNKPWQTDAEAELYFQWRLNVHCCASLAPVLRSCLKHYLSSLTDQAEAEREIASQLSDAWTEGEKIVTTIDGLEKILISLELRRIRAISKLRAQGKGLGDLSDYFDSELFLPLKQAIGLTKHALKLPDRTKWMICLDEAEYLTIAHHRILNTHLRVSSDDFIFKIATMPFAHHTLDTNVGAPVSPGHDFEYIPVDQVPVSSAGDPSQAAYLRFARQMFDRRLRNYSPDERISLQEMLGVSPLIDIKKMDSPALVDGFMELLQKNASEKVLVRARSLRGTQRFKNEVVRKMHGALLLKDALSSQTGNRRLGIYSGESLVIRCSDGNPRRLLRLFNALLLKFKEAGVQKQIPLLAPNAQNAVLVTFAEDLLLRVQSEGPATYRYVEAIGKWLKDKFFNFPLSTDQISSVQVFEADGDEIQRVMKQAVQLSLLIPHDGNSHTGVETFCHGEFYLAYALAPRFNVMPRKDKSVRLSTILSQQFKPSSGIAPARQEQLELK